MRKLACFIVFLFSISAFAQSGTVLSPKKLNGMRYATKYVTAGAGTAGSPYTGWETAITAGAGQVIFNGNPDGSLAYYDVPDAGITVSSDTQITGDGNAILTWGTTRASINHMFLIAAGVTDVSIRGLRFESGVDPADLYYCNGGANADLTCTVATEGVDCPGSTCGACGLDDGTAGGTMIRIGTQGSATPASKILITGNNFGVMRYTAGGDICGISDPVGTHIDMRGSSEHVWITDNEFDGAPTNIKSEEGHASVQYTIDDLLIARNHFNFTHTYTDFGYTVQLGGGATVTVQTMMTRIRVLDNEMYNINGGVSLAVQLDGAVISGNVMRSDLMDGCVGNSLSTGFSTHSKNIAYTNNACFAGGTSNPSITAALVDGFTISGNTIEGAASFAPLRVSTATNGTVTGNAINIGATTPSGGLTGRGCVSIFASSNVAISSNSCLNPDSYGFYVVPNGTSKGIILSSNTTVDTNATAAMYVGYVIGSTCNGCSISGNVQHSLTAPVGGMISAPSGVALFGNYGYVDTTETYLAEFRGAIYKASTVSAFAYTCDGGVNFGRTCTIPTEGADCPSSTCSQSDGILGVNGALYGGDGINAEGSTAAGETSAQKNLHITWTNPTAVRTATFPDESGTVAMTTSSLAPATIIIPNSTSRPPTCTVGEQYMDTDETSGQRLFLCETTDNWVLQGDGGGSISFSGLTGGTNTTASMVVTSPASLTGNITASSILGSNVSGDITGLASNVTSAVQPALGGTSFTSYAQGDMIYATAATTLAKLVKSTTANRYLANTGVSNAPAWAAIDLSVAGSFTNVLLATKGGTGLAVGTSGGINYWSSTTTLASSGLLAANGVVIGGGAGATPVTSATTVTAAGSMLVPVGEVIDITAAAATGGSVVLKEGTDFGTNTVTLKVPDAGLTASKVITFVAATGNIPASAIEDSATVSKCAHFNASGILVAASGDCAAGGGGSGTVTSVGPGCATGDCFTNGLATAGTVMLDWEGTTADGFDLTFNAPADPTANYSLTFPDAAAAITMPAGTDTLVGKATTDVLTNKTLNAESTGNVLTTVEKIWLPAAGCNNVTAASFWDLPTTLIPVATCSATNTRGYLAFPDSDGEYGARTTIALPSDWTGTVDAKIKWFSADITGNVFWQLSTVCVADDETDDAAFNAASTVADAAKGTTLQMNDAAITTVTVTGCAAGELMNLRIMRDRTNGSDTLGAASANLIGVELTLRRAQ